MRNMPKASELGCPWAAIEGYTCDESCRCEGIGYVTVQFMIEHYERMLDEYETPDVQHPLMASIERVVSKYEPKRFAELQRDVENDYGTIGPTPETSARVLHRYIARLVDRGRIVKLAIESTLFAYLDRGSRLARQPEVVRELVRDNYSQDSYVR